MSITVAATRLRRYRGITPVVGLAGPTVSHGYVVLAYNRSTEACPKNSRITLVLAFHWRHLACI
jgi:hypothetical protein